jgi:hypothetical protein
MSKDMSNEVLFALRDSWYSEAAKQTVETLPAFIKMLIEYPVHDYNTTAYATSAATLGASWAMAEYYGITGFQAGCIMWEYIQNWGLSYKNKPLRIVNYDDMLYPMYDYKFTTIDIRTWKWVQERAKELYNDGNCVACDSVIDHWKSIIDGKVPFGYTVRD